MSLCLGHDIINLFATALICALSKYNIALLTHADYKEEKAEMLIFCGIYFVNFNQLCHGENLCLKTVFFLFCLHLFVFVTNQCGLN